MRILLAALLLSATLAAVPAAQAYEPPPQCQTLGGSCCGIEPAFAPCEPSPCPEASASTTDFFAYLGPHASLAVHGDCSVDASEHGLPCPSSAQPSQVHWDQGAVELTADACAIVLDCVCGPAPAASADLPDLPGPPTFPVCVTEPCDAIACDEASGDAAGTLRYRFTAACGLVLETDTMCEASTHDEAAAGPLLVRLERCTPGNPAPEAASQPCPEEQVWGTWFSVEASGCQADAWVSDPVCHKLAGFRRQALRPVEAGPAEAHLSACLPILDCTCPPAADVEPPVQVEVVQCVTDPCPPQVTCTPREAESALVGLRVDGDCHVTVGAIDGRVCTFNGLQHGQVRQEAGPATVVANYCTPAVDCTCDPILEPASAAAPVPDGCGAKQAAPAPLGPALFGDDCTVDVEPAYECVGGWGFDRRVAAAFVEATVRTGGPFPPAWLGDLLEALRLE